MGSLGDRFNKLAGKSRYVVSRLFIHLAGEGATPLLGVLNRAAREAMESEGDLEILGEGLVDICQKLLEMSHYWRSAANEGDVFWKEEEAGDYITELFTDSAQRYLSAPNCGSASGPGDDPLSLSPTPNLVVMVTVAFTGEIPDLEANLAEQTALEEGLKALINLHYRGQLEAIQVHFSPARFGDELTDEQVLLNFPELVPL